MKEFLLICLLLINTVGVSISQNLTSSGTVNLSVSNVDILKEYRSQIQDELNKKKYLFDPKGEFETSAQYESRQKEATAYRQKVIKYFEQKHKELSANKIRESYKRVNLTISSLGKYNADDQYFPITINEVTKNIKVPIQDAPGFKKNMDSIQVIAEQQLAEDGKTYRLFNIKIVNPHSGAEYFFSDRIEQPLFMSSGTGNILKGIPELKVENIDFKEPSGNGYLDAQEKGFLMITLGNSGTGTAEDIVINVSCNRKENLIYSRQVQIPFLEAGKKIQETISLAAEKDIKADTCEFIFSFTEAKGFNPNPTKYPIETRPFVAPKLVYTQLRLKELDPKKSNGKIEKLERIEVELQIKNIGSGTAENASSKIEINGAGIYSMNSTLSKEYKLGNMKPGASIPISFSFIVTNQYTGDNLLPIGIKIYEDGNLEYGGNYPLNLAIDKAAPIAPADFLADVDKYIPSTNSVNEHLYALVIGNENYSAYSNTTTKDADVEYAANDAVIFAKYLTNTLGVSKSHINSGGNIPIKDATGKMIEEGLEWLSSIAKIDPNACLLFYYAGHGSPDPYTHEAYLIPIDVGGNNIKDGIKLDDLYATLAENNPQKAIVFLDACFSGGGRNNGLLADNRSIRVKPKSNLVFGNELIITSSSGTETSAPYHEKQHGLFTYFLLKKLQQTEGKMTLGELTDFITKEVTRESYLRNDPQNPTIIFSPQITDDWRNWKMQ
ncbi:MAG: caspase family protein [Mangrovibacterium sp.]